MKDKERLRNHVPDLKRVRDRVTKGHVYSWIGP